MAQEALLSWLAEQKRAAAFEVAQVDIIAQARADDAAARGNGQYDLGLRIVPMRLRVQTIMAPLPPTTLVAPW